VTSAYVLHRATVGPDAGEDLHAYVRRRRRLPELEAARLFAQALDAVAHCHRSGVVVRDIKLRRFIFTDANRTILQLDGLYDAVVFAGNDDRLTDKHGCLAYVSPEILDATFTAGPQNPTSETAAGGLAAAAVPLVGSYAGRVADVWSLGVMLYTMLVGRYPFADTDACALFARIRRGRYPMPSEVSLSASARCLIHSLLAVNPADRITAEEALQHPWFAAAMSGAADLDPVASALFPVTTMEDRAVPEIKSCVVDDLFAE
jgi:tribbles-like protein